MQKNSTKNKKTISDKTDIQGIQKVGIPNGVYWNAHSQNFYSEETRQGLGTAFYLTWRDKSSEFPSRDGFGNRSND